LEKGAAISMIHAMKIANIRFIKGLFSFGPEIHVSKAFKIIGIRRLTIPIGISSTKEFV